MNKLVSWRGFRVALRNFEELHLHYIYITFKLQCELFLPNLKGMRDAVVKIFRLNKRLFSVILLTDFILVIVTVIVNGFLF